MRNYKSLASLYLAFEDTMEYLENSSYSEAGAIRKVLRKIYRNLYKTCKGRFSRRISYWKYDDIVWSVTRDVIDIDFCRTIWSEAKE